MKEYGTRTNNKQGRVCRETRHERRRGDQVPRLL